MDALLAFALAVIALFFPAAAPTVELNRNERPAGRLQGATLTIRMYAATGVWRPKGVSGPALEVAAFGEEGSGVSTPGPLIRARVGTSVSLTLRNTLESNLQVSGLCTKPGPCESISIAPGASRDIHFSLQAPGTYFYWATRSGPLVTRASRDSQLSGAIVVDPATGAAPDRVFVIGIYPDAENQGPCAGTGPNRAFTINGASWPGTERLRYTTSDTAHWRVINLSCDAHAMHLHGFHFQVEAAGDGQVDRTLTDENRQTVVTQYLNSGRTISMAWTPTRAGNWLFHCHMVAHMARPPDEHAAHGTADDHAGMSGLVIGIEVTGPDRPAPASTAKPRSLTMVIKEEADRYGKGLTGYRIDLDGTDAPRLNSGPVPGPVLVLHRDEPAEITVINRTTQPTAIHWHGIELDSYFDGVPGFGGSRDRLAPPIAPGHSFVAKMTPPRAGTFIYHTHWHDEAQLAGGVYGPLIVLEPGEKYDPTVDHILMIGFNGVVVADQREPFALNGQSLPDPIVLRAGVPNRVRLIIISTYYVALTASLVSQFDTMQWLPIAKDGAAVTGDQRTPRPARQLVSVGETYDFEVIPSAARPLWFDFRRGNGEWVIQAPIRVR